MHSKTGYGRFAAKHGQMIDAHRYSYFLAHGAIPGGLDVHHTCHVRRCVRPEHLRATSRSENLSERKVRRY
ncbi:HNH endonuclease signature motif containing protein [Kitasatospora sp. NPDC101157]|uniref:HNH endonuclease signature motif containing protein n=1 Tax=Kitasatospora sp. NPDC101157 TaxID=3364098 RepID=UPI00381FF688